MPRKKTYNTEEIISLINDYSNHNPGIKLSITKLGTFIRSKGYDIQDHTLRRDIKIKEYIESVNAEEDNAVLNDLLAFKTLDIDAFLRKNNSMLKLKEALMTRERYYENIAAKAIQAIKSKRSLTDTIDKLEIQINELNSTIESLEEQLNDLSKNSDELKKKNDLIVKLRNILNDYIYPDVANAILKKEGILEVVNNIVPDNIIEANIIHANTTIHEKKDDSIKSKFSSLNTLLGGLDEE